MRVKLDGDIEIVVICHCIAVFNIRFKMFQIHKTPNFIAYSSQVFTNFIKFLLFMCTLKHRSYSTVLDRSYNNNNSIGCK